MMLSEQTIQEVNELKVGDRLSLGISSSGDPIEIKCISNSEAPEKVFEECKKCYFFKADCRSLKCSAMTRLDGEYVWYKQIQADEPIHEEKSNDSDLMTQADEPSNEENEPIHEEKLNGVDLIIQKQEWKGSTAYCIMTSDGKGSVRLFYDGQYTVTDLYVDTDARRKGYGTRLLDAAERIANKETNTIFIEVYDDSPIWLEHWYEKRNYNVQILKRQ